MKKILKFIDPMLCLRLALTCWALTFVYAEAGPVTVTLLVFIALTVEAQGYLWRLQVKQQQTAKLNHLRKRAAEISRKTG